jgi:hypothetical protein
MIGLPRTTQSSRFGFEEEEEAVEVPAASVHMIDGRSFSPITSGVSLFVNNRIGYAIGKKDNHKSNVYARDKHPPTSSRGTECRT